MRSIFLVTEMVLVKGVKKAMVEVRANYFNEKEGVI